MSLSVFAALVAVGVLALGLWWWLEQPPRLRARVIVNLTSDTDKAMRGVLWSSRGAWLVLRDCEALRVGQEPEHVDGEIVIHRSNVSFVQILG